MTQAQTIIERLRIQPATTFELMLVAGSTCVHKRVAEAERLLKQGERIEREPVRIGRRTVTRYSLSRAE